MLFCWSIDPISDGRTEGCFVKSRSTTVHIYSGIDLSVFSFFYSLYTPVRVHKSGSAIFPTSVKLTGITHGPTCVTIEDIYAVRFIRK